MTPDLKYLAYTALLTAALWIPHVIALLVTHGAPKPGDYKNPTPKALPFWGMRAARTHINAVEAFAPFAALVIVAHLTGKANAITADASMAYFWLRVIHAAVYLLAVPYVRTLVFTAGFVCVATIFWQIVS